MGAVYYWSHMSDTDQKKPLGKGEVPIDGGRQIIIGGEQVYRQMIASRRQGTTEPKESPGTSA